jgi:hypothetical protein
MIAERSILGLMAPGPGINVAMIGDFPKEEQLYIYLISMAVSWRSNDRDWGQISFCTIIAYLHRESANRSFR